MGEEYSWGKTLLMTRIHIICEGQTEESFVKEILMPFFNHQGISLFPRLLGKPGHKGGNVKFERLYTDIRGYLLSDRKCYVTTFFDFYGLPEKFPGKKEAVTKSGVAEKSKCLLDHLRKALEEKLDKEPLRRFILYVQMYEFEGLLFSDPEKLAQGINCSNLINNFQKIRKEFSSPEEINNSSNTAPSKQIKKLYPAYGKPTDGLSAAIEIGIDTIRKECSLFNQWLERLEKLTPILSENQAIFC
ncbi:DUF4276 family protein [Candidatus Nitrosacidococcus sp. I8]|uniref:DUF4276 family protein n=1 Tax=Candidatus Nitrosacidococcus sp. I8 TaxID=2942908 RepID=UPI002226AD23|nr:DUF4276 family protein [Candidatus Nitrosacidococcus sp. I8]CAH9017633.1 hypothetical protein NURINAE_00467 [Candidatus Nitrosacidococcus sp. I8]